MLYPPDWQVCSPGGNTASEESLSIGPSGMSPITISLFASSKAPRDWFFREGSPPVMQEKTTTVNGYPAYYVAAGTTSGTAPYTTKSYVLSHNNQILGVAFSQSYTIPGKSIDYSQYAPDFDLLAQSIKFLSESSNPQGNRLVIKEWGVQFTLTSDITG
jgi:hypothetical protein